MTRARAAKAAAGDLQIVRVRWRDAVKHEGWARFEWLTGPVAPADSVGFVVHEDAERLVLAMTIGTSKCADVLKIPRGMIDEVVPLGTAPIQIGHLLASRADD